MERSSADAWHESYVKMLEEYISHHRPRFYYLLPWLSKTHDNLSEFKNISKTVTIKRNIFLQIN